MQFKKNYDVFKAFLVENANYEGYYELPCIKTSKDIPNNVVTFSRAMAKEYNDYDAWVVFYENDCKFVRLWNNPKSYLKKLQKFKGVVSPDFSLYRNMPLVMQMWSTYQSRAISVWLSQNGIEVIPNVRWNDERTYDFCFDGIEKNSTVAVGTHGCIKKSDDRVYFKNGLSKMVKKLTPKTILVYGTAPDEIFKEYKDKGINIVVFESEFSKSRRLVSD